MTADKNIGLMSDPRAPGKRSACDRCRTQKLRCLRADGHPKDHCVRCVRSQVDCVTSSSKRPGRPTTSSINAARQRQQSSPSPLSTAPSLTARSDNSDQAVQSGDISLADVDDLFNLGPLDANFDISSACWTSVDSNDALYSHDFQTSGTSTTFTSISDLPTRTAAAPATVLTDSAMRDTPPEHPAALSLFNPPPLAQSFDHGLRLSILYCDLSKLLFSLKSMPWDMADAMRLTCIPGGTADATNHSQASLNTHPLASITRLSAEFSELLWSTRASLPDSDSSSVVMSARKGTGVEDLRSSHPRMNMADLLTTLSCHILIVSIYDEIFCQFIEQMMLNPEAINLVMQSAPRFYLGGAAVPPWPKMLGHLLFCLIESQLRPIELLLGLPDEFCVSLEENASRDEHPGLFSGQSRQSLFAVLGQVDSENSNGDRGGLGVVESLKEKTQRVQCFK